MLVVSQLDKKSMSVCPYFNRPICSLTQLVLPTSLLLFLTFLTADPTIMSPSNPLGTHHYSFKAFHGNMTFLYICDIFKPPHLPSPKKTLTRPFFLLRKV